MSKNKSWRVRYPMTALEAEAEAHNLELLEVFGLTPETLPILLVAVKSVCQELARSGGDVGCCVDLSGNIGIMAKRVISKNEKRPRN